MAEQYSCSPHQISRTKAQILAGCFSVCPLICNEVLSPSERPPICNQTQDTEPSTYRLSLQSPLECLTTVWVMFLMPYPRLLLSMLETLCSKEASQKHPSRVFLRESRIKLKSIADSGKQLYINSTTQRTVIYSYVGKPGCHFLPLTTSLKPRVLVNQKPAKT